MGHQLIKLTSDFFTDHAHLKEIEKKTDRPYNMYHFQVYGHDILIPFRSYINHPHAVWTDKKSKCGLDLSKAVILTDVKYLDSRNKVVLRKHEYIKYIKKKHTIEDSFIKYVSDYEDALKSPGDKVKAQLVQFSTLQNYHEELNINVLPTNNIF